MRTDWAFYGHGEAITGLECLPKCREKKNRDQRPKRKSLIFKKKSTSKDSPKADHVHVRIPTFQEVDVKVEVISGANPERINRINIWEEAS